MDMLCIAAESDPTGYVLVNGRTLTATDLARLTGAPEADVQSALAELDLNGVFSRDRNGRIYNRRMVRDARAFAEARKYGKEGGNPKLTSGYNKPGQIYLVGVRADGAYKVGISTNPAKRLTKIRAQYPGQDLVVIDAVFVTDMGTTEASLHSEFAGKRSGEWFFLTPLDVSKIRRIFASLKGGEKGGLNPHKPEARSQKEVEREESKPQTSITNGRAPPGAMIDFEFAEFWRVYPRRDDRGHAVKAYRTARKKADQETLVEAAKRYAAKRRGQDPQFTALAATWLTGERWTDEPAPPDNRGGFTIGVG